MVYGNALQSYQKAQVSGEADPQKLILMLYEAGIKRLRMAKDGMEKEDIQKRGENIGKAIAIISELNASLDESIRTEEINFLRSLYMTMMTELTKVSLTNDIVTVERAIKYLKELKRIWETSVMKASAKQQPKQNQPSVNTSYSGYGSGQPKAHSIAV
ncbi:MAG: flagellar export chaperone FliS [Desulfobacterales bacterium]|nr:flagellar export chaperone FliS [Desulfobacterales bacterium]